MAASDSVTLARLFYYGKERLYNSIQTTIIACKEKYGPDPVLTFYDGFALLMQNQIPEAMRELSSVRDHRDVVIASSLALIMAHKRARIVDKEAVTELETRIKIERTSAGEQTLYFAGIFLTLCGRPDKGRDYFNRMAKITDGRSVDAMCMLGWCELLMKREGYVDKAEKYLLEALGGNQSDISTLMGLSRVSVLKGKAEDAINQINKVVVQNPKIVCCLLEKLNTVLALQYWDQVSETANRVLQISRYNIQAQAVVILSILCREGGYKEAGRKIGELVNNMDRFEPKAHYHYYVYSACFSRMCGRNSLILQQAQTLLERAVSVEPENCLYHTEMGNQLFLQGQLGEAKKSYKTASRIDESAMPPCLGGTRCILESGSVEDAASQLDFLYEISETTGRPADMYFLKAMVAIKQNMDHEGILRLLQQAVEIKTGELANLSPGFEYFVAMDPEFLLQIAKFHLSLSSSEPLAQGQPQSLPLVACVNILNPLCSGAPGLLEALFLFAKVKYLTGSIDGARALCQECINRDVAYGDAHLLMAKIALSENNNRLAMQSLEIGLSYNFELMESPIYHFVQAVIQKEKGSYEESLKTLKHALGLYSKDKNVLDNSDKISIYLELIEVHKMLGQTHEAAKIMQDAINEFQGTSSEIRIAIANADLAISRGDYNSAVNTLKTITPDKSHFSQARKKLAEIYYKHRKDKKMYIMCFQDLIDVNPSPENYILLGDAFMNIQEPEKAISVYESALKKNPKDGELASKIGAAFVKTHNYNKAINYYETAIKQNPSMSGLRYDLCNLLVKLKQLDKAEKILRSALGALEDNQKQDSASLVEVSRYKELLAKVAQNRGQLNDSLSLYASAADDLDKAVKRALVDGTEDMEKNKSHLSYLYVKIAEHNFDAREFDVAITNYRDALTHTPDDIDISLSLADIHLSIGQTDEAQSICSHILQKYPNHERTTVTSAIALFQKGEQVDAINLFQNILQLNPSNFEALAALIDLLRRSGKNDECQAFLDIAEKSSAKVPLSPGFNYCKGLYAWYSSNSHMALKYFNLARKDSVWGEKAVLAMIKICLNPDNETTGGEVFKTGEQDNTMEKRENDFLAIKAAEKLLHDLRPTNAQSAMKLKILENYCLIATKNKQNIEQALESFMEIVATQSDHVPALLGSAIAFMSLKQTPRARNQLKRIAKMFWNPMDADEFEQGWLLLADIYITNSKYDMALDLIKKCTFKNESCFKAWEYMGYINEKEASYKDAAANYEKAWIYSGYTNPTIGYKLAFNYLKARRFVDAIAICHKVLQHCPNYPKIKKEILEKARSNIRV